MGIKLKKKLMIALAVIVFLTAFGRLLYQPPSFMDFITGATPRRRKAEQEEAVLEGQYVFGMNTADDVLSDSALRDEVKAFVKGTSDYYPVDSVLYIDVPETDYALIRYAENLASRIENAGAQTELIKYSSTMILSRVICGKYQVFLISSDTLGHTALENTDILQMSSEEMADS